jgi:hypothetical protein
LRTFNHLTELCCFAALALVGNPDTARAQSLTFSPNPVSLSIAGPGSTVSVSVPVSSTVALGGSLQITSTNPSSWLCAQPNGTTSVTVIIGTGCPGTTSTQLVNNQTYTGQIIVSAPTASNGLINGTLNVNLQVGTGAVSGLIATPNQVNFNVQTGGSAASQNVALTLNGAAVTVLSVSDSTTTGQNWLLPSANGSSVLVSVNASGLSSGTYIGSVTANTSAGSLSFPVNLTVGGIPTLTVSPAQLNFAFQSGTTTPLPQTISLTSNGSPVNVSVSSSTTTGGNQWLIVSPLGQLTTPTQITVAVQPGALVAGTTYVGNIQINSSGGATNGTVNIPVNRQHQSDHRVEPRVADVHRAGWWIRSQPDSHARQQWHGARLHGDVQRQFSSRRFLVTGSHPVRYD